MTGIYSETLMLQHLTELANNNKIFKSYQGIIIFIVFICAILLIFTLFLILINVL